MRFLTCFDTNNEGEGLGEDYEAIGQADHRDGNNLDKQLAHERDRLTCAILLYTVTYLRRPPAARQIPFQQLKWRSPSLLRYTDEPQR